MRFYKILLFISLFFVSNFTYSQDYTFTTLEVVENVTKRFNRLFSTPQEVSFSLMREKVRTGATVDSTSYVSVQIKSQQASSEIIQTTGFAIASNLNSAYVSSTSQTIQNKTGVVQLNKPELDAITQFLNETIKYVNTPPSVDTGFALDLSGEMQIAFIYERANRDNQWKYYLTIGEAEFEVPYDEGRRLMGKLVQFGKQI